MATEEQERLMSAERPIPGYMKILKEIGTGGKELLKNEVILLKAEAEALAHEIAGQLTKTLLFGALVAFSILPFLAFLVIGLGVLLNNRYWLSSLIVAVVCAAVGGIMARKTYIEMKQTTKRRFA